MLSVGAATLRVDGDVVVDIPAGQSGGTVFGYAAPERRVTIELEAGRAYAIEVDYPLAVAEVFRGFAVGARHVPADDPIAKAAAVAAKADAAVVVVGTDEFWETEAEDRTTLSLPGDQDALVAAVAAANPTHRRDRQQRGTGDDAVARRRRRRRCSCGSPARSSATPSPRCSPATKSPAAASR